jgi:hypothetical protein
LLKEEVGILLNPEKRGVLKAPQREPGARYGQQPIIPSIIFAAH